MDLTLFFQALDKSHTSPEGVRLLEALGITEKDFEKNPMNTTQRRLYESKEKGILLNYTDEPCRLNIPDAPVGKGPWVLDQLSFWSGKGKSLTKKETPFTPYPGELPYGLNFDMLRPDVSAFLGTPDTSNVMAEGWQKDGHRLLVGYDRESGEIRSVGLQAPLRD